MTVCSNWYDYHHTILHIVYQPGWTWKDMHWHDAQMVIPTVRMVQNLVALILDFSAAPLMPPHEFSANIKQAIEDYRRLDIDVMVFTMRETSIAHLLQTSHRYYGTAGRVYLTAKTVGDAANQIQDCRMLHAVHA